MIEMNEQSIQRYMKQIVEDAYKNIPMICYTKEMVSEHKDYILEYVNKYRNIINEATFGDEIDKSNYPIYLHFILQHLAVHSMICWRYSPILKECTDFNKLGNECCELLLKKNADYGNASFDLGLIGNFVHIWDKSSRIKKLMSKNDKDINYESLEDSFKDLLGYAIIGLHILQKGEIINKL